MKTYVIPTRDALRRRCIDYQEKAADEYEAARLIVLGLATGLLDQHRELRDRAEDHQHVAAAYAAKAQKLL